MIRPKNLTYLVALIAFAASLQTYAGNKTGIPISYYFGYYLEDSIDSSTIHILKKEGYEIIETDSIDKIIYVKTTSCRSTPESIEAKLKKVVYLGSDKKEQKPSESSENTDQNFDFLNVFFFTL